MMKRAARAGEQIPANPKETMGQTDRSAGMTTNGSGRVNRRAQIPLDQRLMESAEVYCTATRENK